MVPSKNENIDNVTSPIKLQFNFIFPTQNTIPAPGENLKKIYKIKNLEKMVCIYLIATPIILSLGQL